MNVLSLFDGKYEISDTGVVFSCVGRRKELVGKINQYGYRMVVLTVNGKKLYKTPHRLVAEAFLPNPENHPQVNHKDCNKLNNSVENLEWCTPTQNLIHARDNGLLTACKINMDIANQIREDYNNGIKRRFLVEKYGIRKTQINCIINFERWK